MLRPKRKNKSQEKGVTKEEPITIQSILKGNTSITVSGELKSSVDFQSVGSYFSVTTDVTAESMDATVSCVGSFVRDTITQHHNNLSDIRERGFTP